MSLLETAAIPAPSLNDLLISIARGQAGARPQRQQNCVIFDIEDNLHPGSVDAYAARIVAFHEFLSDYYLIRFKFAGVQRHCIRVFLEPEPFSKQVRNDLVDGVDTDRFHRQMARLDIARLFIYGKTLVITQ